MSATTIARTTKKTSETGSVSVSIVEQINAPAAGIPAEPAILTAGCFFWSPAGSASGRRRNEERRQAEVAVWLSSLGFNVERSGDSVCASGHGLEIRFSYSETCHNVYRRLEVTRAGRRSNIAAIRKVAANR